MESNNIIKEIKVIKILLYVIVICLLLILLKPELLSMYLHPSQVKSSHVQQKEPLHTIIEPIASIWSVELVKDAFQRGKLEIVMEMCNNRIQEYPNDPYGYWYRARALKILGENQKALRDLDAAESLAPTWKKKYTDPLRKDILKQELIKRFEGMPPKDKQAVTEKLQEIYTDYKKEEEKD